MCICRPRVVCVGLLVMVAGRRSEKATKGNPSTRKKSTRQGMHARGLSGTAHPSREEARAGTSTAIDASRVQSMPARCTKSRRALSPANTIHPRARVPEEAVAPPPLRDTSTAVDSIFLGHALPSKKKTCILAPIHSVLHKIIFKN